MEIERKRTNWYGIQRQAAPLQLDSLDYSNSVSVILNSNVKWQSQFPVGRAATEKVM